MNGWVKIHRRLRSWEWYQDANTFRVFMHLILSANHKDRSWRGKSLFAGQVLTGRVKLAQELGMSEQQIRTALDKLKSTNEISIETTTQYSVVTLVKWASYQFEDDEITNEAPARTEKVSQPETQPITTNKNDKNNKKERSNNITQPPEVPEQLWKDFLAVRAKKRAPLTVTALQGIEREAVKAGISLPEAIQICVERSWQGFKAEWHLNSQGANNGRNNNGNTKLRGAAAMAELGNAARRSLEQKAMDDERQDGLGAATEFPKPAPTGLFAVSSR